MTGTNFEYSLKNIPTPSRHSYLMSLMDKAESFLRRVRWKAYFHECSGNDKSDQNIKNYGFLLNLTLSPKDHLNKFENAMCDMIKNIEF